MCQSINRWGGVQNEDMTFHAANAINKRHHTNMFTITVQSPNLMQCYNLCTCTRCLLTSVNADELELHQECRGGGYKWHLVWPCRIVARCWGGVSEIKCFAVLAELLRQRSACIWQNRAAVLSLAFLWLAPVAQMIPSKTHSSSAWQSAIIFHLFL